MRDNEDCLVFDPRDTGVRLRRKILRFLEADDYEISMTHHGKILVRWYIGTLYRLIGHVVWIANLNCCQRQIFWALSISKSGEHY